MGRGGLIAPRPQAHVLFEAERRVLEALDPLFELEDVLLQVVARLDFGRELALLELQEPHGNERQRRNADRHGDGRDHSERRHEEIEEAHDR